MYDFAVTSGRQTIFSIYEKSNSRRNIHLPVKLEEFLDSLQSCVKYMHNDFGSKIVDELFEKVLSVLYKKTLRQCLKLIYFACFWNIIYLTQAGYAYGYDYSPHDCTMSFAILILVLLLYRLSVKPLSYYEIKVSFTLVLSTAFAYHMFRIPLNSITCQLTFFSPIFEISFIMVTISSIKLNVTLSVLVVFILSSVMDLQMKMTSCFWNRQNQTMIHQYEKLMNLFPYSPPYIQIFMNRHYEKSFRSSRNGIQLAFSIMMITCFTCCVYVRMMNNLRRKKSFLRLGQGVHARKTILECRDEKINWVAYIMPSQTIPGYLKFTKSKEGNSDQMRMNVFSQHFNEVSILFSEICGFQKLIQIRSISSIVKLLHDIFIKFDFSCGELSCEKLGTFSDRYHCVSGCPNRDKNHAVNCIDFGVEMLRIISEYNRKTSDQINIQIGINTGEVNAAVIGNTRFRYDVYSTAVLIADEMRSHSKPGKICISEHTLQHVKNVYSVERGADYVPAQIRKGYNSFQPISPIKTYFIMLDGKQNQRKTKKHQKMPTTYDVSEKEKPSDNEAYKYLNYCTNISSENSDEESPTSTSPKMTRRSVRRTLTGFQRFWPRKIIGKWDTDFVNAIENDPEKQVNYFFHPPIHPISLKFARKKKEIGFDEEFCGKNLIINSPSVSLLLDCIICTSFHLCFTIALFSFTVKRTKTEIVSTAISNIFNVIMCIPIIYITFTEKQVITNYMTAKVIRSIYGFLLPNIPFILLISFLYCSPKNDSKHPLFIREFGIFMCTYVAFIPVTLFHSCSSCIHIITSLIKGLTALIYIVFYIEDKPKWNETLCHSTDNNSCKAYISPCSRNTLELNQHDVSMYVTNVWSEFCMIIVAVIIVCRKNEIIFRLNYFICSEAELKSAEAQETSKQANELLNNIAPKYVLKYLKQRGKEIQTLSMLNSYYFEVPSAAIAFVNVTNFFSVYYREDYKKGESAIWLLHEMICLFDNLLPQKKYKDLEKVRTFQDCYSVVAGLDLESVNYNVNDEAHLNALMDFCFEMMNELNNFNDQWIIGEEKFTLKIGYNIGPVAAGIIGTTKPMLDIWGNAVEVAKSLCKYGESGKINVTFETSLLLRDQFKFKKICNFSHPDGRSVGRFVVCDRS